MAYVPTIWDWRPDVAPIDQVFRAGGQSTPGGMTVGGIAVENPEPGGRGELHMNFSVFAEESVNLNASWTVSRLLNGSMFRIRLYRTVQLVTAAATNVPDIGQTWSNGLPWANDANWRADPFAPIAAPAGKGASSFTADLSILGEILQIGHVVGFYQAGYDFCHMVLDIDYDARDIATVTVEPPLRRALTTSDNMLFRPSMIATCQNARDVAGNFTSGRHMQFNPAVFREALV